MDKQAPTNIGPGQKKNIQVKKFKDKRLGKNNEMHDKGK